MQDSSNPIADAMELLQVLHKQSILDYTLSSWHENSICQGIPVDFHPYT